MMMIIIIIIIITFFTFIIIIIIIIIIITYVAFAHCPTEFAVRTFKTIWQNTRRSVLYFLVLLKNLKSVNAPTCTLQLMDCCFCKILLVMV